MATIRLPGTGQIRLPANVVARRADPLTGMTAAAARRVVAAAEARAGGHSLPARAARSREAIILPPVPFSSASRRRPNREAQRVANLSVRGASTNVTARDCLNMYLEAFKSPFNASGVCFPHSPAVPSAKFPIWHKGVIAIGAGGTAFIMVQPVGANDVNAIYIGSGTSYDDPTAAYATSGTGVTAEKFANSPYDNASFGATGVQFRAALTAMRVRYIGAEDKKSGRTVSFVDPHHHDISGKTLSNVLSFAGVSTQSVDRQWKEIRAMPARPDEFDYSDISSSWSHCMGFQITGAVAELYEYEIVLHAEYIGTPVANFATNSEAHPWTETAVNALTDIGRKALQTGQYVAPILRHAPRLAAMLGFGGPVAKVVSSFI